MILRAGVRKSHSRTTLREADAARQPQGVYNGTHEEHTFVYSCTLVLVDTPAEVQLYIQLYFTIVQGRRSCQKSKQTRRRRSDSKPIGVGGHGERRPIGGNSRANRVAANDDRRGIAESESRLLGVAAEPPLYTKL